MSWAAVCPGLLLPGRGWCVGDCHARSPLQQQTSGCRSSPVPPLPRGPSWPRRLVCALTGLCRARLRFLLPPCCPPAPSPCPCSWPWPCLALPLPLPLAFTPADTSVTVRPGQPLCKTATLRRAGVPVRPQTNAVQPLLETLRGQTPRLPWADGATVQLLVCQGVCPAPRSQPV